jgi:hypothetical protein
VHTVVRILPKESASEVDDPHMSERKCECEGKHACQCHEVHDQCAFPETRHLGYILKYVQQMLSLISIPIHYSCHCSMC